MTKRPPLRAITLIQPWAHCIVRLGKRVENRTWTPPVSMVGGWLAIHAGKKLDREALEELVLERGQYTAAEVIGAEITVRGMAQSAIVALVRLDGWVHGTQELLPELRTVTESYCIEADRALAVVRDRYWAGPVGWVLGDVVVLPEPVPCRGAQGLWTVTGETLDQVRAGWARAAEIARTA